MKTEKLEKRLGIIGGGQLGKMLLSECHKMNISTSVLDPSDKSPCRSIADKFTLGDFNNFDDVYNFGKDCDIITFEIEHINVKALEALEEDGKKVFPKSKTLKIIQDELNDHKEVKKAWQLNERHYGALTGLNKDEMKIKLGEEKVHQFRRSWDFPPGPLSRSNPYHPLNIERYNDIPRDKIPDTESLKDTYERVIPYFKREIEKKLSENIIVSAHGNSIRSLCKYLFDINNEDISKLEIPTGNPLVLKFDNNIKLLEAKYLDKERAKDLIKFN